LNLEEVSADFLRILRNSAGNKSQLNFPQNCAEYAENPQIERQLKFCNIQTIISFFEKRLLSS
jgi:hypothetical protein